MAGSSHRVRRVVFDLTCEDQAAAFIARKRLAQAFTDSLATLLEEAFEGHSPNGRPFRVRRLVVDLGILDLDRLDDRAIRQRLLDRLRRKLIELRPEEIEQASRSMPAVDAFVRFLKTGRLPWDSPARNLLELERIILEVTDEDRRVLAQQLVSLFGNPTIRIRFSRQFGSAFFLWAVALHHPEAPLVVEKLVSRHGGDLNLPEWRVRALTAFVTAVSDPSAHLEDRMESLLSEVLTPPGEDESIESLEQWIGEDEVEKEVFYTRSAGIVLLHPFLVRYFGTLGLLNEERAFASFEAQLRAIHLLHYLTTGEAHPEEPDLILEKVLCGLPIGISPQKELELKESERAESEALLSSVIAHWARLGDTSPDGLRQGFLQREGKFVENDGRWELTVEQKGIDVLLASLPWSLNRIALPWMPNGLRVDWA